MKKKVSLLLAGVLCVTSFAVGVMSKSVVEKIEAEIRGDFQVVVDGKKETFKNAQGEVVYPILYEGTTYLPIRAIGELMGKTVYWYQDEKRIELVEKTEESLVTDADVIIDKAEKAKPDKTEKQEEKALKDEKKQEEKALKEAEKQAKKEEKLPAVVEITEEDAKAIALKKAELKEDDVKFIKVKLEKDDGVYEYDVEFRYGTVEYEAEISAADGTIKSWDVDND